MEKGLQMKEKSAFVGEMEKSGENEIAIASEELVSSIRPLIEQAKAHVAQSVNSELVLLYWQIGKRISDDLPAGNRAEYGAKVVELVSKRLAAEYGKGFRRSNVFHMIRFAEVFDDAKRPGGAGVGAAAPHYQEAGQPCMLMCRNCCGNRQSCPSCP